MCQSKLHDFLVAVPKCEHHMHLEGALSPSLLFTLASRNNITLAGNDSSFSTPETLLNRYDQFTSLDDFLHYYFIGMSCLVHTRDFEDLAWHYFQRAKAEGVIHAELFFDPQAHTSRGVTLKTIVTGFQNSCERARDELGISTLLIPCFLRHLPLQDSEAMWQETLPYLKDAKLAGIGLSGSETAYPPGHWSSFFEEARLLGIRRTAHAGEEGPVEFIEQALKVLRVQRIDHGFKLVENESLMKELAKRGTLVTLCPLSNVKLKCVQSVTDLPIRRFLDAGVQFSLNSDDPSYFKSYILDNYCAVQDAFDLSRQDWIKILLAAVDGSWCCDERKAVLREKIETIVQSYNEG